MVLSTKNLTQTQKEQVLIEAGIIASNDKINASLIQRALVESTLDAEKQKEILTTLGLVNAKTGEIISSNACTKAALEETLAKKGIIGADAEAIISSIGLTTSNSAQAISFDLLTASIWANVKAIGAWLVTNPVGWAILGGTAIFGLVKAYDALTDSVEEVKERTDSLFNTYNSAISEANSNAQTIESLASKYEKLSKGVNNLGENVSLTTDEYEEYNDIVNQIADMFPTMINGYTNEGNAILSLKGNVEELIDAYKEAQKEAYNLLIIDGNDIITNYQNQVNGNEPWWTKTSSYFDGEGGAKDAIDIITKLTGALTPDEFRETYNQLYEEYKNIWYSDKIQNALKSSGFEALSHAPKWSEITEDDLANVRHSAQATIQTYQSEIDSQVNNIRSIANAYLMTNSDYEKLDDQSKTLASLLVNTLDDNIANEFSSKEDIGAYVSKIVASIKDNEDVQTALIDLFSLDESEFSVDELNETIDKNIKVISDKIDADPAQLKIRLGFDDTDTEILKNNVKNKLQDVFDDKVGELTLSDLQIAAERIEVPEDTLLSWDELIAKIEEVKNISSDTPITASISQLIDQLNTQLKPTFDSLKSAYQDIFTDNKFNLNAVDISMLEKIKSDIEDLNNLEDVDININMDDFDTFAKILTDVNTTEEQAQQAFDDFATSIFNATFATEGITDETAQLVEQLLESLGVVNANEVAQQALNEAKAQAIIASYDLANASEEEYAALLDEAVAAGIATQQVYKLIAAEIAFGNNDLSVEQKIDKLHALASAYGDTASAALATAIANDLASGHTDVDSAINDLMTQINSGLSKVDVDFSGIEKDAKKAGSSAGKSYAESFKDELESTLSGITGLIDKQISTLGKERDQAVTALERERDLALEAVQAEIDGKQEVINNIQSEIDSMREANEERKRQLSLQQALFAQQKAEQQHTKLIYNSEKGLHYEVDYESIRDAKEQVENAKFDIEVTNREKQIDLLQKEIDLLEKRKDSINDYYAQLIEDTENYWDSLIESLEEYKSRWEELSEIEENAKLIVALRKLGIETDDILNMSGEAFDNFKEKYLSALTGMYSSNGEMLGAISESMGEFGESLPPVSQKIDTTAKSMDNLNSSASNAESSVDAISNDMDSLNTSTTGLSDNLNDINDALTDIPEADKFNAIADAFINLGSAIQSVADALGVGTDGTVGGLVNALQSLNDISLGADGEEGIIVQFNQLKSSIEDVTNAISGGGSSGRQNGDASTSSSVSMSYGANSQSTEGGNDSLIGSINDLGTITDETLGESGGEGAIGKFEEFGATIAEAEGHVQGVIDKLNEVDGMHSEATITINIETNGSIPSGFGLAEGTALDSGSTDFVAKYGAAHVEGTALASGNWAVQSDEKSALMGEIGYEIIVRNGRFFTVGDNGAEMVSIKKGDIVFNHEQSEALLKNGHISGRGKAYADGTVGDKFASGVLRPPQPGDPMYDNIQKINAYFEQHNSAVSSLLSPVNTIQRDMGQMAKSISTVNNVNNSRMQNVTIGDIHVTCPGVTSQEVMMQVGDALNRQFSGLALDALQKSKIR